MRTLPIHALLAIVFFGFLTSIARTEGDQLWLNFANGSFTGTRIDEHEGWQVLAGQGLLFNAAGFAELELPASDPPARIRWSFPEPYASSQVLYVAVTWRPVAIDATSEQHWSLDVAGARVAFVFNDDGIGSLHAATGGRLVVSRRPDWVLRESGTLQARMLPKAVFRIQRTEDGEVWDLLSSHSHLRFADLPLDRESPVFGRGLELLGSTVEATSISEILLSTSVLPENSDQNGNGIPDVHETYWGPMGDWQRYDDKDGDSLTTIREIDLGTNPRNPDTDGDGINDGDEVAQGTDPLAGRWHSLGTMPSEPTNKDISHRLVLDEPFILSGTTTLEDRIHFLDTIELVSSGQADFVDATNEFLRAHPQSPFRVWIGVSAAWRAFGQRRFTLAQQLFEMMPPSNATAAIYLARLYVLKGDYELARNALAAVNIARLSNPLLFQYDIVSQALDYESRGEPWKSWSGHYAVMDLARDLGWDMARLKELLSDPPKDGTQILQLRDWAQEKGIELDVVAREP